MASGKGDIGSTVLHRVVKPMTVPMCVVCGTFPFLAAPLAAAGLFGAAQALHSVVPVLGLLNLALLWSSYRRHRNPTPAALGALGVLSILLHFVGHSVFSFPLEVELALIWIGSALLAVAVIIDWRNQRRPSPAVT